MTDEEAQSPEGDVPKAFTTNSQLIDALLLEIEAERERLDADGTGRQS